MEAQSLPLPANFKDAEEKVGVLMGTRFHILRIGAACNTQAVAQAPDIDSAISRVRTLGIGAPGRYLIVSQTTGNRFYLDADANGIITMLLSKSYQRTRNPYSEARNKPFILRLTPD